VSDVASMNFNIIRKKAPSERSGVLYIDFSNNNFGTGDNTGIKAFYENIFSSLNMPFTYIRRAVVNNKRSSTEFNSYHKFREKARLFPITFLQDFEYVIVASDLRGGDLNDFVKGDSEGEIEGFVEYINSGGKVILTSNYQLRGALTNTNTLPAIMNTFLRTYFGFPTPNLDVVDQDINELPSSNNNIFLNPTPVAQGAPILNITTVKPSDELSNNVVLNGALNSATCISDETKLAPGTTVLYRFNCISPTIPAALNGRFNNKPVAFKFTPANPTQGTTWTFTFPIYHLQPDSARELMRYIMGR